MLRNTLSDIQEKFFGKNPMLNFILRNIFKTSPLKAMLLSIYALPVRNLLRPADDTLIGKYTFTVSPEYYSQLHDLLSIGKAENFGLVRVGQNKDGGYVMLDDFSAGGIAYSFGIANDVSWDKDMVSRGYDVFMYDHTIDRLPEKNSHFHWSKLGIADGVTKDERLKTLEELISVNHHEDRQNMILKMDVEGAEWGFFENVKSETLAKFSQMTLEIHDMINPSDSERTLNALRKINETHQLVHLHANNIVNYITIGGKNFCSSLEVSYVLRSKYKFIENYDVNLPLDIDMPCINGLPEIELGHWNEKMSEINETVTHTSTFRY